MAREGVARAVSEWVDEHLFSDLERYTMGTDDAFAAFDNNMFRDTRVYLECPYHEKDQVKELGARWDNTKRKWYAPPGTNLEPLILWMTAR